MLDTIATGRAWKTLWSTVFILRALTAAIQGAVFYVLIDATDWPVSWPATEPRLFVPLLLVSSAIPSLTILGLGQLRPLPLLIWTVLAALATAGLGLHDVARAQAADYSIGPSIWPGFHLCFALGIALFIAQALVVDAAAERRFVPAYARHFDTAWKQGVQIVLASVFVGVFWGVLYLGAELFRLVDISYFHRLIGRRWFAIPATALAWSAAIHVTDVQPALIRGARSIALALFSWLLPLLALILLGFLGCLPFISLFPLWRTHFAATLLLISAAMMIFLINSCYQDGAAERTTSRIKRLAATIGSLELIPLAALAICALSLRVRQYGWTVDRITAASLVALISCYALGYGGAVFSRSGWLKPIEIVNFLSAYVFLALFLALFSPLADPARLMAADQVARLKAGLVPADKFDFSALRYDGARWGAAALQELSVSKDIPNAETVNRKAARVMHGYGAGDDDDQEAKPAKVRLQDRLDVYPAGRTLPDSFFDEKSGPFSATWQPSCRNPYNGRCIARFVTLRPAEAEAVLFMDGLSAYVIEADAAGQWRKTAGIFDATLCPPFRDALKTGQFQLEPHMWPDIVIGDQRISIKPLSDDCHFSDPG
jgi:hypothetical protein